MCVIITLLSVLFISRTLADRSVCNSLIVTAPKTLQALSGSCLHIPCNFSIKKEEDFNSRTVVGVWIKSDSRFATFPNNVVFNSSQSVNVYPMNITGNLSQKDCRTLFSDLNKTFIDTYFFRIESKPFMATAVCNSLQINVTDSAWSPSIDVSGDVKNLKEAESVSITCSAQTPCPDSPPELTWSLQQDSQRTEKNPDGTFTTKIQKSITLSDTHDGDNITCSVRYPVDGGKRKTAETNLTLSVSYAPKDTSASISPSGVVSAGSWVELSCSSRAKPPVRTFTWFRNTKHGPVHVHVGQVYSFNVSEGGEFYCVALNDLGNQTSPVVLLNSEADKSLPWVPMAAGITGIVLLIVFVLIITYLRQAKAANPPVQQQRQHQTNKEEQLQKSTEEDEEIHYGEIQFSNQTSNPPSTHKHQQDVVYAQVRVNPSTQTGPEDLYAQVTRK